MSKVIADARSAVADLPKGATLLVGGFGLCGIPEELIEAVRDLGRKELTIVSNNAGTTQFGLVQLLRNNQVRKVMASYVGENDVFEQLMLSGSWTSSSCRRARSRSGCAPAGRHPRLLHGNGRQHPGGHGQGDARV